MRDIAFWDAISGSRYLLEWVIDHYHLVELTWNGMRVCPGLTLKDLPEQTRQMIRNQCPELEA